jgi:hypothetical protein
MIHGKPECVAHDWLLDRFVCAQHGRDVNGVKVLCRKPDMKMKRLPSEANSGRATDLRKEG